jgi:hypothetical protein
MAERGAVVRYAYWSDRRVRNLARDLETDIEPNWKTKITAFRLPLLRTGIDLEREPRTLHRNEIATRIERAVGDLAVEDFVTPPKADFAKGTGWVQFSHFVCDQPDRVILHTRTQASDGTRVVVCLFGSRDNMPDFVGVNDPQVSGWTSSAMWSVLDWLSTQCTENNSQWDDPESISVEAFKIATRQGNNDSYRATPNQPWTRGFTFGDASEAEWFAEIYSDVVLDKDRWTLDDPVDRILVGAPVWIRTPRRSIRRYRDSR